MAKAANNTVRTIRNNARIAGTQKYCMGQASILVLGTPYTPTEVIQIYEDDQDTITAVASARLAYTEAVAKATASAATTNAFDKGFKLSIEGAYGNSPTTMGTFGIADATPTKPSVATKAAALTKTEATRALRHTAGKKQKLAIKAPIAGTAAPLPVTPASAPAGGPSKT